MSKHLIQPPQDNIKTRTEFLQRTKEISDLMSLLRELKMKVYGMNWMKRGWDSTFQNLDRKFGIIEEIMWGKIIAQRVQPSDEELIHLADALTDLGNYAIFGRWLMEVAYPAQYERLKGSIEKRTEVINPEQIGGSTT